MTKLFVRNYLCLVLLTLLCASPCFSQEQDKAESIICSKESIKSTEFETKLASLRKMNIDFSVAICKQMLGIEERDVTENINPIMKEVYTKNKAIIAGYFPGARFKEHLENLFDVFGEVVTEQTGKRNKLGKLAAGVNVDNVNNTDIYFNSFSTIKPVIVIPDDDKACKVIEGVSYNSCREAFKDIAIAFNAYRAHYDKYVTGKNKIALDKMSDDWSKFVDKARNQTLLDVWATTYINNEHYKQDHLVSPASSQYFFIHPGLVYEHVSKAPAGEKDKASVAIEWAGINWWNLKVPFGLSVVTVYADRPEVSEFGHGLMVYIDNKYSFGWVHRDKSDGIFFGLDILKLFSDKKQQLEQYKSML